MLRRILPLSVLTIFAIEAAADVPVYSEVLTDGSEITYECMPQISGAGNLTAPKIRFLFVRFPQANEGGYSSYPDWADPADNPSWLESELQQYFAAMSVGAQQPDIDIVVNPSNPGQPWTASRLASVYVDSTSLNFNLEMVTKVHNAYLTQGYPNGYWVGVNYIFVVAYDQPYSPNYSLGGFTTGNGQLPGANGLPGLPTGGYASHLFVRTDRFPVRDAFNTPTSHAVTGTTVHEFGHVLGMPHAPYSGNYTYPGFSGPTARNGPCAPTGVPPRYHLAWDGQRPCGHGQGEPSCPNPCGGPPQTDPSWNCACIRCGHAGEPACTDPIYVNVGRYDPVRGIGGPALGGRINPYHPRQLSLHTTWLTAETITTNMRDFHIPQLRHSDPTKRKVYVLKPPQAAQHFDQYFLLSNHQGNPADPVLQFDANYQGHGLLIWHINENKVWDLESAEGEIPDPDLGQTFTPNQPYNPPRRGDSLARSWDFPGSGADFFNNQYGVADFSATTNPNSNYYAENFDFFSPQTVPSHIGVENIRQDSSGDMIVDIYVDPTQYVTAPNGGELVPMGQPLTIRWLRRPYAGIGTVDIHVSSNGGSSYSPLITGLANPQGSGATIGEYVTVPFYSPTPGAQWRVRVRSHDSTTNAMDESNANFTLWGIKNDATFVPTVTHSCFGPAAKVKVRIDFTTSIATDGDDELKVYSTCGGTPLGTAVVTNPSHTLKTNHTIEWEGYCTVAPGTVFHVVARSQHGTSWAQTACTYIATVTCMSCGGGCNPPCEFD